jgi:hypothetical protein
VVCAGQTLQGITEDQFMLASRANISLYESNEMADFEREAMVNLVVRDIRNKVNNTRENNQK